MPQAGDTLEGPGGLRLRLVRTEPELLEMEATYGGSDWLPPEHLHPRQTESFEVLDGTMRTIIGGSERVYAAGETFEVPAGTPHQMAAPGPARVRWEVRPALRTAEFFERLYAGPGDRDPATFGAELLTEFADEISLTGR
jgi:hypothetical protein